MSVSIKSTARTGSAAVMTSLLDELYALTYAADRPDLADRLVHARARVNDPTLRIVVTGQTGQGMSSLVDAIAGAPVTSEGAERSLPVLVSHSATPYSRPSTSQTSRIEVGVPNPLLAQGVTLIDAPGIYGADTAAAATVLELVASADAVLFVSDASQEYTAPEVEFIGQLRQLCPTVVGVVTKIDLYERWSDIQRANRAHLDTAGLDIPLLPVSAMLAQAAQADQDTNLTVESGVPQLVDFLRQHVIANANAVLRASVINDIQIITDQLMMTATAELEALRDPTQGTALVEELQRAVAASNLLRAQSARWQLVLGDGIVELIAEVEHDLRHRLRGVVREAEADIMKSDPAPRWDAFDTWLQGRIAQSVQANFVLAHARANELAERVADQFAAQSVRAIPQLHLDDPSAALAEVQALEDLESRKAALGQLLLNTIRGSYGGILMVGVLTSVAGLALLNPWSIGAGVLLGANTFWEERKARTARRQSEAKVAVARLMDDVLFQVGDESKYRLREVHRTLRDHFTEIASEMARSADDALRAAQEASYAHSSARDAQAVKAQASLGQLHQLRARAATLHYAAR